MINMEMNSTEHVMTNRFMFSTLQEKRRTKTQNITIDNMFDDIYSQSCQSISIVIQKKAATPSHQKHIRYK